MVDVVKVAVAAAMKARPPKDGEDPTAWRWFMAVGLVGTAAGLVFHIALACGFLTMLHPGFASATDQEKVRQEAKAARLEVVEARIESLEARIFDLRIQQCEAVRTGKNATAFTYQLQGLLTRYMRLEGKMPGLPTCEELK